MDAAIVRIRLGVRVDGSPGCYRAMRLELHTALDGPYIGEEVGTPDGLQEISVSYPEFFACHTVKEFNTETLKTEGERPLRF